MLDYFLCDEFVALDEALGGFSVDLDGLAEDFEIGVLDGVVEELEGVGLEHAAETGGEREVFGVGADAVFDEGGGGEVDGLGG